MMMIIVWYFFRLTQYFVITQSQGNEYSFLHREISATYFKNGLNLLSSSPIEALHSFQKSFEVYPTIYAYDYAKQIFDLFGLSLQEDGHWNIASDDHTQKVLREYEQIRKQIHAGRHLTSNEKYTQAFQLYENLLKNYPNYLEALFLEGAVMEQLGNMPLAASIYDRVLQLCPIYTKAMLSLATLHQKHGDYMECFPIYEQAIQIYELYLSTAKSIRTEEVVIIHEEYLKIQGNLILAYFQKGSYYEAIELSKKSMEELLNHIEFLSAQQAFAIDQMIPIRTVEDINSPPPYRQVNRSNSIPTDLPGLSLMKMSFRTLTANLMVISRSATFWKDWELLANEVFRSTYLNINIQTKKYGPLLPFDSLLLPLSLEERWIIAHSVANQHHFPSYFKDTISSLREGLPEDKSLAAMKKPLLRYEDYQDYMKNEISRPYFPSSSSSSFGPVRGIYSKEIRIGFISYDFNDHPTAHLLEGFFRLLHTLRAQEKLSASSSSHYLPYNQLKVIILAYGKNDGSEYRQLFIDYADEFYDIATTSYQDVQLLLEYLHLQILFEMQVHTLGNRMAIISNYYYQQRYLFLAIPTTSPSPSSSYSSPGGGDDNYNKYDLADNSMNSTDHKDWLRESSILTTPSSLLLETSYPANSMIVVNYLVYPGTSGSFLFDYLFCDRSVVVIEKSHQDYSERLLVIPFTYQISYYSAEALIDPFSLKLVPYFNQNEASSSPSSPSSSSLQSGAKMLLLLNQHKQRLRRRYYLPLDSSAIIFCNFNKVDKIDPFSFQIWMNIMRKTPNSFLWLLEPALPFTSKENITQPTPIVKANLHEMAEMHGVSKTRILFAPRVKKTLHIQRHLAADLFLDTFTYSAHSTATDSLRGGLPVLTVAGNSFPNRVGFSLYRSFPVAKELFSSSMFSEISEDNMARSSYRRLVEYLVVDNVEQFEETAIRLVQMIRPPHSSVKGKFRIIDSLKLQLLRFIQNEDGLFKAITHVEWLRKCIYPLIESYHLNLDLKTPLYHLILTD